MALRIGFDMDGVVADFAAAYHDVEVRLFGPEASSRVDQPEREEEAQDNRKGHENGPRELRRRRDAIWMAIRETTDFWTTLKPTEAGAVRRIFALAVRHRWEVFFITQRPETDGDTVQRQTQRWLADQGFDLPTVLVIGGSRGAAAGVLRLNYHVDDNPQNCIDMKADSHAQPILIVPDEDAVTVAAARKLGIATARGITQGLDILEQASAARSQPKLLERLAALVGWKS